MRKLSFGLLTVALVFTACTKQNDLLPQQNKDIASREPATESYNPLVYFIDKDTLYAIKNIGTANSIVEKKAALVSVALFNNMRSNVFNMVSAPGMPRQRVIYNPFLNRLVVAKGTELNRCFIPSRTNSKLSLNNTEQGATVLRVGPDKKLYYFSWGNWWNPGPQLRSMQMDGTNDHTIVDYVAQNNPKPPLAGGEINFDDNVIYVPIADGHIYVSKLHQSGIAKIFVPAILEETFLESEIRYDALHHKIFFSSIVASQKIRRIYSMDALGNLNTIKKIAQVQYTDDNHTFTFDIVPSANTVVFSKREFNQNLQKHTSVVTKVKMDGTGLKPLFFGTYINTVVTADVGN